MNWVSSRRPQGAMAIAPNNCDRRSHRIS